MLSVPPRTLVPIAALGTNPPVASVGHGLNAMSFGPLHGDPECSRLLAVRDVDVVPSSHDAIRCVRSAAGSDAGAGGSRTCGADAGLIGGAGARNLTEFKRP